MNWRTSIHPDGKDIYSTVHETFEAGSANQAAELAVETFLNGRENYHRAHPVAVDVGVVSREEIYYSFRVWVDYPAKARAQELELKSR